MNGQAILRWDEPAVATACKEPAQIIKPVFNEILTPWRCRHHEGVSQIEVYLATNGKRHVIAETYGAPGIDAERTARQIVDAINERAKMKEIIEEVLSAIDLYLESVDLSWEAEQEMDIVCRKARRLLQKPSVRAI